MMISTIFSTTLRTLSDINSAHRSIRMDPGDLHSDPQATMIVSAAGRQTAITHTISRQDNDVNQACNQDGQPSFDRCDKLTGDVGHVGTVK